MRDLLLGLPVHDIDLAVEGDAVALARRVGEALRLPARVHGRFGTATLELAPGQRLDFATTRREAYERPGALPVVSPASLEEDLFRRDFTINAMALELAPSPRPQLHDPFDGRRDLSGGRLRILHLRSFQDDPTRAYRAARYANRLGFRVEAATRRAAREAARGRAFDAVSGDRKRREIRLLLSEPNRAGGVAWLERLDLPRTLHPALDARPGTLRRLRAAERLAARLRQDTIWILYLLAWAARLRSGETAALARRLSLAGEEERILRSWPAALAALARLPLRPPPSALAQLRLSPEQSAAAAVGAARADVRALLRRVLTGAPIELAIRGADLVRAGVPPGPAVGRALARTLSARRDGMIPREGELEFALEAARRESS